MKQFRLITFLVLFALTAHANQNGLYFNSHSFQTPKRTTLYLNQGESIDFGNDFTMKFQMDLRSNEAPFGNIFCIKTNNGHHIDAIFSAADDKYTKPTIVVDGKFYYINFNVTAASRITVEFNLNRKDGTISYSYGKEKSVIHTDVKDASSGTITFGMHTDECNYYDVAPIIVRDILIRNNGKNKYFWPLSNHFGDICVDTIENCKANTRNGTWLYDTHVKWTHLTSIQSKNGLQVAYNEKDNIFYIVDTDKVSCFNPVTKATSIINVKGGKRIMPNSDYLFYDALCGVLFNYGMTESECTRFNLNTGIWESKSDDVYEPRHGNHAWTRANDSISYAFGGYGYYRYKNDLFRINQRSGKIEQIDYSPKIKPRTGCAACFVDDQIYIFGGYGNESGKQELPGEYFFSLVKIDLKTLKSETLWEGEGEQNTSFQLGSEMIYDKEKNVFYAVTTNQGGRLIRISLKEPKWDIVTDEFKSGLEFRELTFHLFENKKIGKIYVALSRYISDYKHDVDILSLDYPLQDNYMVDLQKWNKEIQTANNNSKWLWLLLLIIPIAAAGAFVYYRKKAKVANTHKEDIDTSLPLNASSINIPEQNYSEEEIMKEKQEILKPSQITLLGKFAITDKEANDITSLYSKRLRDLLLIIILNTQKKNKGVEIREIDDNLWQNMSEVSARNNRNVNISKLRMLMEKVGDVEINNDKTYYHIRLGNEVTCDYIKAMKYMARINDGYKDEKTVSRTLELLLKGPLVPHVSYEWLDPFKAKYSESALALLNSMLYRAEQEKNDTLALKIAETIMLHDPFNDHSLNVQCCIHSRHNRKGIAKKVYDNFCKVYRNSMGEEYDKSFVDVCK